MTARGCLYLTAAVAASAILTGGCARQTRSGGGGDGAYADLKEYSNPFIPGGGWDEPAEFRGSGDITIYQNRQKSSAKIDVRSRAGGYFSAQLYSPFGSAIAEVDAEDFKGSISAGGERREFSYGDKMFGLPFPGAGRATFGEFIKILTTGIPEPARKLPQTPVSAARRKRDVVVMWAGEAVEAKVKMAAKNREIVGITFQCDLDGAACVIELGRIKEGAAREISIREAVSGNYITIKYDTVKTVK